MGRACLQARVDRRLAQHTIVAAIGHGQRGESQPISPGVGSGCSACIPAGAICPLPVAPHDSPRGAQLGAKIRTAPAPAQRPGPPFPCEPGARCGRCTSGQGRCVRDTALLLVRSHAPALDAAAPPYGPRPPPRSSSSARRLPAHRGPPACEVRAKNSSKGFELLYMARAAASQSARVSASRCKMRQSMMIHPPALPCQSQFHKTPVFRSLSPELRAMQAVVCAP